MGGWSGDPRGAPELPQDGTIYPLLTARACVATCSVVPDLLLQRAGDPLSSPVGPGHRDGWEGDCVTPLNPLHNASLVQYTYPISLDTNKVLDPICRWDLQIPWCLLHACTPASAYSCKPQHPPS